MSKNIWKQLLVVFLLVVAFNYLYLSMTPQSTPRADISYSRFKSELAQDNIEEITVQGTEIRGTFAETVTIVAQEGQGEKKYEQFRTHMPSFQDDDLMADLEAKEVEINSLPEEETPAWVTALLYLLPWVLIIGIWWVVMKKMRNRMGGGGMMGNFSKSGAQLYSREKSRVSFDDVAGLDEAKQDLHEIVDYLRDPEPFSKVGGKVPRGLLLVGPPGTGKTLMARAVAGEAGAPFFSISASQFIEMFVGVGASRVRDLFKNAKKQAPSIIFIDELDAVGRSRGAGLGGGNDEREQTLNQLLSELDGFEEHTEVIVMAATNRPDVLDPALLRPGRFDRQVAIDRPDWRARRDILKVHVKNIPLADDVDLEQIAKGTPGMVGADLESLVNEAALMVAREKRDKVTSRDLERAKDKIIMGAERKLYLTEEERRITAFHEGGHALVARFSPEADPIHKVTIIPRGRALGATQQLPEDDRYHYRRSYLSSRLAVAMGGRVAEKLIFGEYSTGAQNDLKNATELAEKMVCQWGMSDQIGPVHFDRGEEHPFLGRKLASDKSFSERMAWIIDREIEKLVREGEKSAGKIIEEKRDILERLVEALLEEEVLEGEYLREFFEENPKQDETPKQGDDTQENGGEEAREGDKNEMKEDDEAKEG